jgi:hypothetical protein
MNKRIDEYLDRLKDELKGSDRALVQDALADVRDHLILAFESALRETPGRQEQDVWQQLIEKFGTPAETALAYKDAEARLGSPLASVRTARPKSFLAAFLGVFTEARAWGALIFCLLSFLTGLIYSTWAIVGGLFSLLSLLLIIGIPVAGLFLFSLTGIALVEGRIVEALLAVRMPRRPLFVSRELTWLKKIKTLLFAARTWKAFLYFVLQFPLGFLYLVIIGGLFVFSLIFIASPILELVFRLPLDLMGDNVFTPIWLLPLVFLAGLLMLPLTLHLAKWIGKLHGRYAKAMLVGD